VPRAIVPRALHRPHRGHTIAGAVTIERPRSQATHGGEIMATNPPIDRVQRNREVIHRFYRAVNAKQRDEFYEIVHPDFVNHGGASGDIVGPKALVDSLDPFYAAMPDWHVSEDFVVAEGDRVASRGTISGTHSGSFMGIPPTGKKLSWSGIIIYRLDDDGKVIERWQDFDALGMLQQMGAVPPLGGPAR
jgi:steroid delta-isomerase-like uncharacterized protein